MAGLIEVKHLKKYFPTSKGMLHAVDDVSLKIEKKKTMGVVGESGCGKSTLGRTIIHLLESTGGKIYLEGKDVTDAKGADLKELRKKMQIIFQDPYSSLKSAYEYRRYYNGAFAPHKPRMQQGRAQGKGVNTYKARGNR